MRGWMASGAALTLLAGAALAHNGATTLGRKDIEHIMAAARASQDVVQARILHETPAQITEELNASLSDRTKIIYTPGYGVYVEYSAADGRDRMWFPRNPHVVEGHWGVKTVGGGPRACFHYLKSHDAMTGEFEPTECIDPAETLANMGVIDTRPGDAFGLLSGAIPYVKDPGEVPAWPSVPVAAKMQ